MSNTKKRTTPLQQGMHKLLKPKTAFSILPKHFFESLGFEGVTIEKLAQAAEVSAPTIYALYQSKRGVLFALMDEALPSNEHRALVEKGKMKNLPKPALK